MPKFNKMYFPVDAIAKHEDFDVWYSDGERALRFEGPWEKESDRIAMIGRMGGQIGQIRPDNKALNYYLRHDRFEYEFQPASSRSTTMSRACCGTSMVA